MHGTWVSLEQFIILNFHHTLIIPSAVTIYSLLLQHEAVARKRLQFLMESKPGQSPQLILVLIQMEFVRVHLFSLSIFPPQHREPMFNGSGILVMAALLMKKTPRMFLSTQEQSP